ncbi:MAG: type II and III secretion system protein, partial [Cellvibrionaceae bacterium]|nr:type II and III secretion system protein [Cellvibrionaceae bacterium]
LTTVTIETEKRDIGNSLKIWPRINSDKTVTLDIEQEASSLIRNAASIPIAVNNQIQNFPVDQVDTARINLTAIAKEGLTIAVGGMIREAQTDNQDKVPLLGDIPGLGKLFRSDIVNDDKTELVLLITPYIYDNAEDAAAARAALQISSSSDTQQLLADKRPRKTSALDKSELQKAVLMTRAAALYQLDKTAPGSDFTLRPALFKNWRPQLGMEINAINTLMYEGWEVSTVEIQNRGRFPLSINPESFSQSWVAFSSNRQLLQQGEKTIAYFVSREMVVDTLHQQQQDFEITPQAIFIQRPIQAEEELSLEP